jgi:uncharacterized protein (DUF427 family)
MATDAATDVTPPEEPRVRLEPAGRRLRVTLGGATIVDSPRAVVVHERGLPPRYYVPRADVSATLKEGPALGRCPWKGSWRWLDVSAGGQTVVEGAWSYPETTPVCEEIRGHVAFVAEKMGSFELVSLV